MAKARRKAPFNISVIQKWVGEYAREHGVASGRLERWIMFMIVLAVLDRVRDDVGEPLFLLKGGAAMELRLQLGARATKDIDTVFRESMESMLDRLDEALQLGWGDFTFERTTPEPIKETRGLEGLERVPCLGVRYQIAQKIHACTEPPVEGKDENPRFHDLIDLILLRDLVADDGWPAVRGACVDTFETRGKHAWPPDLVVYPSWPPAYAALAADQGFDVTEVEDAARQVREMITRVDRGS